MVKIRLSRRGKKNAPSYRIVVMSSEDKRDGKALEIIGHYNPTEDPNKIVIKQDRYDHWLSVGAQSTPAVSKLVKGTYKFVPYTRQNEKKGKEESTVTAEAPSA
jgi:small subunit ribosomal protein S16